jgi:tuberculosinol/isotuberculosinol synthase
MTTITDPETFLKLSTSDVAMLVRAAGPQVCVFPINGTRRWFMFEHGHKVDGNSGPTYVDIIAKRHIEIYQLCFSHGLDTLLTPIFGGELLHRGEEYLQIAADGISRVATHPDFLSFYQKYEVRVRFYGDYRKQFKGTPFAYLSDLFDHITKETAQNNRYRLFYGVFANDPVETVAEFSVRHFQKNGIIPSRKEVVAQYYGEDIDPATIFIGFDKFSVFDYPLINLGEENLYFTVAPSLYLDESQLRNILYDHIFLRHAEELDYAQMSRQNLLTMRNFYQANRESTMGIGELRDGIWYPLPQVVLPPEYKQEE